MAASKSTASRPGTSVLLAMLFLAGCSSPVAGNALTSTLTTNTAGRISITFNPCKEIPADVIQQQKLDSRPPQAKTLSDGDIENIICKYRAQSGYYVSVAASNYTLDMDKKITSHWGWEDLKIGNRKALGYYLSAQPETSACAIDVAATSGVYGVSVSTGLRNYSPYPDCMTAVRAHTEAFLPYFPT